MTSPLACSEFDEMDRATFVARLGKVYEHSPWVAERAWAARPFADRRALEFALQNVVRQATRAEQLALLRQHPRLGLRTQLTEYSQSEQTGAGLLAATAGQREQLERLNDAYEQKFGFPFIVAVRGMTVASIIDTCRTRLNNESDSEFAESLRQVFKIAGFRLAEIVVDDA